MLQLSAPVAPVLPPQNRGQHAIVAYKHYQAAHSVVHRQPPKTHAALVQQVHQDLHKVPQARHVFDEAKQRFGQHFTTGVPLDKCVAQCVMMLLVQQSLEVSLAYVLMTLPELHDCPSSHPVIQSSSHLPVILFPFLAGKRQLPCSLPPSHT